MASRMLVSLCVLFSVVAQATPLPRAAAPGHATSQDNIGGPTSRIGAGSHGRYCDYCRRRFFDYLARANRSRLPGSLAELRKLVVKLQRFWERRWLFMATVK